MPLYESVNGTRAPALTCLDVARSTTASRIRPLRIPESCIALSAWAGQLFDSFSAEQLSANPRDCRAPSTSRPPTRANIVQVLLCMTCGSFLCPTCNESALHLGSRASRRHKAGPQTPARQPPHATTVCAQRYITCASVLRSGALPFMSTSALEAPRKPRPCQRLGADGPALAHEPRHSCVSAFS